ncbi:MAG: hypothetical protein JOZ69_02380 [Myxococcales bacterium]|nr:hypothetical protein [Myxococcales bacterium]
MRYYPLLWSVVFLPFGLGCQELDPNLSSEVAAPVEAGSNADDAPAPVPDALPDIFGSPDLSQPCPPNSALCYQLCGSPTCALPDNSLPPNLGTPPIMEPDGGLTPKPCEAIEAQSFEIRKRSCSMCHGANAVPSFDYTWVLDDHQLVTNNQTAISKPIVIPGDPVSSELYQRVQLGIIGGSARGMPLNPTAAQQLDPSVAKSIVYPTSEDLSILYAWILNCVEGTDGGAYSSSYYGAYYGPDGGGAHQAVSGGDAGPASSGPPAGDAGAPGPRIGDAGGGKG